MNDRDPEAATVSTRSLVYQTWKDRSRQKPDYYKKTNESIRDIEALTLEVNNNTKIKDFNKIAPLNDPFELQNQVESRET